MFEDKPLLFYKGNDLEQKKELEKEFEIHSCGLPLTERPELILLDLGVRFTPRELTPYTLLVEQTGAPLIIRTWGTPTLAEKEEAISVGAVDILPMRTSPQEVTLKIRGIINNNRRIKKLTTLELGKKVDRMIKNFSGLSKESDLDYNLSPREKEVAGILKNGLTNKEVAAKLNISEKTIATHIKRIYTKMNVNSRAGRVF